MSVPETKRLTAADTEDAKIAQRKAYSLRNLCVCGGEMYLAYSTLNRNPL